MATGFIAAAARGAGNTRRQTHTPARRPTPRRHRRWPINALVAALTSLAFVVSAAAETSKITTPAHVYAPPRQCYAFNSQGDIYLSCGASLLRVTYRGDIDQFAISTDGRIFAFAAGFGPTGPPKLRVVRFPARGEPRETEQPWGPNELLTSTCGVVLHTVELFRAGGQIRWPQFNVATGGRLANWAAKDSHGWVRCSADGRASLWADYSRRTLAMGTEGKPPQGVDGTGLGTISPDGASIAYARSSPTHGAICTTKVAAPSRAACLRFGPGMRYAARPGSEGARVGGITGDTTALSVNGPGGVLIGSARDGRDSPRCYILKQNIYLGQILSTQPKPGYVPVDAPCPALLYWKPGMPIAEILHPEMVPQYAQWVSPAAARRLRAWAAHHRPKPKQTPR